MNASTQVALITGAANGLGWGLTQYFWQQGYSLFLIDRDEQALTSRQDSLRQHRSAEHQKVEILALDLTDARATGNIELTFKSHFNALHLLINNAGITHRSLACDTALSVTEKVMQLDFFVPVALTQTFMPLLTASGTKKTPATVINTGSMAGWMPVLGRSGYCAAKSALHQYFETLRAETAHLPLHYLMVYPSFLATDIEKNALSGQGESAQHARSTAGQIHTVDWMVKKIAQAYSKRRARLFPNKSIALASVLYRLLPGLFLRLMRRKFAVELNATTQPS